MRGKTRDLALRRLFTTFQKNKIQTQACISKKTQGHVARIVFLSTCFAVGLFLSWLRRSLNFRTSPKDTAAQSKTNGKVTWTLPLCNAVEEPLGWAALQEPTPDTSGTLSPIGQTGETFLFIRGKEKKSSSLDPVWLQHLPWEAAGGDPPVCVARRRSTCRSGGGPARSRSSVGPAFQPGTFCIQENRLNHVVCFFCLI